MKRVLYAGLMICVVFGVGCAKKLGPRVQTTAPVSEARSIEHTIAAGETLRRIAANYYGDPDRAADIVAENGIAEPDHIVPGSVLKLSFSASEWGQAQRRATALAAYNKGVDFLGHEKLGEAEKQFQLALKTAPELAVAEYNLALVLIKRGHHDKALGHLVKVTNQNPDDIDFRFARGNVLFLLTRFSEATEQFQLALDISSTDRRSAFGLARSLQEGGQAGAARRAWERYLVLDDTSSWASAARKNLRKLTDGQ